MSASTLSKMGSSARSAGNGIPACAIRASSPTVFNDTVLPPVLAVHFQCERDHRTAFGAEVSLEQGMASVLKDHNIGSVVLEDFQCGTIVLFCKASLGELQFEFRQNINGLNDHRRTLTEAGCHFREDAVDFCLFFFEQPDEIVILLDSLHRLDENRLPGRTGAVHDPRHSSPLLDLHGNHETLAANCDQLFLNRTAFGEPSQMALQTLLNLALLLFGFTSDASEFWRCAVVQRSIRQQLVAEVSKQFREIDDARRELRNRRPV